MLTFFSTTASPPMKTIEYAIINSLPPGSRVLSLHEAAKQLGVDGQEYKLQKYVWSQQGKANITFISSSFLTCDAIPPSGVGGYFCINETNNALKTTVQYLPGSEPETVTLEVKASTDTKSEIYRIVIYIADRCTTQKTVYEKWLTSCKPDLKEEDIVVKDGMYLEMQKPDSNARLMLDSVEVYRWFFTPLTDESKIALIVSQNGKTLASVSVSLKEDTVLNVSLDVRVTDNNHKIQIKAIKTNGGLIPIDARVAMKLYIYDLVSFCKDNYCLDRFYHWESLTKGIGSDEKSCIEDRHQLREHFSECYGRF